MKFPSPYQARSRLLNDNFIVERLYRRRRAKRSRPKIVYHYTNSAGLLGIVKSRAIWATNIEYLNDANEFRYARDVAENVIGQLPEQSECELSSRLRQSVLESIREARASSASGSVFVTSFSEFGDSLSQWRGYGAQIGGYALGFTLGSLFVLEDRDPFAKQAEATHREVSSQNLPPALEDDRRRLKIAVIPCLYNQREQKQLVVDWYQHLPRLLRSIWKDPNKRPVADEDLSRLASIMLEWIAPAFKDPAFHEEHEWRLVIDLGDEYPSLPRVRAGQTTLIPYVSVPLADSEEPLQFAKVIVGPTPLANLAKTALSRVFAPASSESERRSEQRATALKVVNSTSPFRAL